MPGVLNAVPVAFDTYTDAATALFTQPRQSFTVTLAANAAAYYKLGFIPHPGIANTRDVTWEHNEHHMIPGIATFRDPAAEGLPPGSLFAGIQFRRVTMTGASPVVTVA
jgi:hypothetical protein